MTLSALDIKTVSISKDQTDDLHQRFAQRQLLKKTTTQATERLLQDTMNGKHSASTESPRLETMATNKDTLGLSDILLGLFTHHSSIFGALLSIYFVIALLTTLLTISIGHIIAHHQQYTDTATITQFVLFLSAITLGIGIFSMIRTIIFAKYEVSIIYYVQSLIMKRLFNLPMSFFEQYTTGDLCYRVLMIESLARLSGQHQIGVFLSFTLSTISFLTMFYFTWKLTLLTLAIVSVYLMISIINIKKQLPHIEKYMGHAGDNAAFTFNMSSGMSRIKVFCCDVFAEAAWARLYSAMRQKLSQIYRLGVWRYTITNNILLLTLILVFFLGTRWEEHQLPLEHYIIFYMAFIQLLSALVSFSMQLSEIAFSICAFRRIQPILQTPTENNNSGSNRINSSMHLTGAVVIKDLQFHYPQSKRCILNGLSFHIAEGEHIAIVGLSGAGKSTLLKLLLGFYFPEQGQILFDNQPIQNIELSVLRKQMGVVFQDSKLMTGSLLSNIIDESAGMTEEDAWEAVELVGLKEFIESLPMKMHTMVAQHVNVLSGGQKQLLLIARALVAKPRLLILDEATNSLDPRAQEHIANVIRNLPITCIIVAHRMTSIRSADRILVLDQGRVVEEGTYPQLLRSHGLFYRLTQQQAISFQKPLDCAIQNT